MAIAVVFKTKLTVRSFKTQILTKYCMYRAIVVSNNLFFIKIYS